MVLLLLRACLWVKALVHFTLVIHECPSQLPASGSSEWQVGQWD